MNAKAKIGDEIVSGAAKGVGQMTGKMMFGAASLFIGIFIIYLAWDDIGTIFTASSNITNNTSFRVEQTDTNDDFRTRLTTLEAKQGADGNLKQRIEDAELSLNKFSNRFSDVEEDTREAKETAKLVSSDFQAYRVESDRDRIQIEKEVANLANDAQQAKVERDRNTDFSSTQPQRAATRIEQIATLRRDANLMIKQLAAMQIAITRLETQHEDNSSVHVGKNNP